MQIARMTLKFAANISMLFKDSGGLVARYEAARQAGFQAVECTFPYSEATPTELSEARHKAGVEQILINSYPGTVMS